MKLILLFFLIGITPAFAQQGFFDPDKAAYEIQKNAVTLSEVLKNARQQIDEMAKQNETLKKQIEDLKTKCGDPCNAK